jgi:HEAT repeat protein
MSNRDFQEQLKHLSDPSPSESVLYALSNLDGARLDRLAEVWASLPADQRAHVIARLVEIAEADFELDFNAIFRLCLDDGDPRVRCAAIEGLWEVEDVRMVRPLVHMLGQDESAAVREAAAVSLSRFALLAELGRLPERLGGLVWDALWTTIHNPQEAVDVRRRAIESLAYFDRPQVTEVIRRAYEDEDSSMHLSAVFAMGRSADDDWANIVTDQLIHEDPAMRYEAARACGALQLFEAVPMLSRLTADLDLEVKLAAVWALGQIGGPEAQRVLDICAEMGDEALKDAAQEALEELSFMQDPLDFPLYDFDLDDQDNEDQND